MSQVEHYFFNNFTFPRQAEEGELNVGYFVAVITFFLLGINTLYLLPLVAPYSSRKTTQKFWKWRNTVNSLLHAATTGIGSLFNLWLTEELRSDLLSVHTPFSLIVNAVTVGYFIFDLLDLILNNLGKKNTTELLLHHAMVIICFGLALITRRYQGYAMVSLLLEVNSIFLHIRQLFILHDVPKSQLSHRIVSYFNIGTFVGFRLLPLTWQVRWLAVHKDQVPQPVVVLGFITSAIIMILNLGLLVQIVNKDFLKKESGSKTHTE